MLDEVAGPVRPRSRNSGFGPVTAVLQQEQRLCAELGHPGEKLHAVHIFQLTAQHHHVHKAPLFEHLQHFFAAAVLAA